MFLRSTQPTLAHQSEGAVLKNRDRLRTWARIVMLGSLAIQLVLIGYSVWDFDDRLSCDRMRYWNEWLSCMHGYSHDYVWMSEFAVASWLAAGFMLLLSRFLPAFVSALLPIAMIVGVLASYLGDVERYVRFRGALTASEIITVAIAVITLPIFLAGPAIGAWLLGIHKRRVARTV